MGKQESEIQPYTRRMAQLLLPHHGHAVVFEIIDEGLQPNVSELGETISVVPTGIGVKVTDTKSLEALLIYDTSIGEVVTEKISPTWSARRTRIRELQTSGYVITPSSQDLLIGYRRKV